MTAIAFVAASILALVGMVAFLPYGILSWLWFTLQAPHQIILVNFPLNMAIVVACTIAILFNRKHASIWVDGTLLWLAVLLAHCGLTTMMAFRPDYSYPYLDRMWKTIALGVAIAAFMQNRTRIQAMVWVSVMSIGAIAAKGATFAVVTAGAFRIWGPRSSQIEDNNHLAGVLCMVIPFAVYLHRTSMHAIARRGLVVLIGMMLATVLFSYSRTGLVALFAVGFCYWLMASTRHKTILVAAAILGLVVAVPLMPQQWLDRMGTLSNALNDTSKLDESARSRFETWSVYYRVGKDHPFFGQGFRAPQLHALYSQYVPNLPPEWGGKAAHNNVMQVLGEHGFVGLAIYGIVLLLAFKNASSIMLRTRHIAELDWARSLGATVAISLTAYMAAGITISIPYYDLFFVNVIILAMLRRLVHKELAKRASARFAPQRFAAAMAPHGPAQAPRTVPK